MRSKSPRLCLAAAKRFLVRRCQICRTARSRRMHDPHEEESVGHTATLITMTVLWRIGGKARAPSRYASANVFERRTRTELRMSVVMTETEGAPVAQDRQKTALLLRNPGRHPTHFPQTTRANSRARRLANSKAILHLYGHDLCSLQIEGFRSRQWRSDDCSSSEVQSMNCEGRTYRIVFRRFVWSHGG